MADFLTIKEFAELVHYSPRQIRQFCIDGKINARKLVEKGRKWIIPVSEVERFIESSQQKTTAKQSSNIRLDRHQQDMLNIAQDMLADGLKYLSCRHIKEQDLDVKIYSIRKEDGFEVVVEQDWDIIKQLRDNYVELYKRHNLLLIKCFCEHLETGYPYVVTGRLQDTIDQNPFELIETLCLSLARRKVQGNCIVCRDDE